MQASQQGHLDVVTTLLQSGADINVSDEDGRNGLLLASHSGHTDIVRVLLNKGANVNILSRFSETALMLASSNGHMDAVNTLLDFGAIDSFANDKGNTALLAAASENHWNLVQTLINLGSDELHRNIAGEDVPMYLASGMYQNQWAVDYLEKVTTDKMKLSTYGFHTYSYSMSILSFILIAALLQKRAIPENIRILFRMAQAKKLLTEYTFLYGYLPRVISTNHPEAWSLYPPCRDLEGKIGLHTLATAILCKLPISAIEWLTKTYEENFTNMLRIAHKVCCCCSGVTSNYRN